MLSSNPSMLSDYADVFAFLGNSFLAPMSQTERHGLDPEFWAVFPDFGDPGVECAIGQCLGFAKLAGTGKCEDDLVQRVSVEYTRLFVGPPRPAVAPWETFQGSEGATYGFGEPTFAMQRELAAAGLEVSNENNQYADHIGIELLLLSELVRKSVEGEDLSEPQRFVNERLLPWVGRFAAAVGAEAPAGYYAGIAALASSLCIAFAAHAEG